MNFNMSIAGSYWFVRANNLWTQAHYIKENLTERHGTQRYLGQQFCNQCEDLCIPVLCPIASRFYWLAWAGSQHYETSLFVGKVAGISSSELADVLITLFRYPFMFGAIQMAEHDPTLTTSVVNALHKFVALANTMLHAGQGVEAWTQTRWEDFVIVLQWWVYYCNSMVMIIVSIVSRLYDNYPNGKEDLLIDTMQQLKYTGVPWEKVFSPQAGYDYSTVSF